MRRQRTISVRARDLSEGDVLPDERRVIALHRDAAAGTVDIVTDEPVRVTMRADDPVPIVSDAPRQGWRGALSWRRSTR